jgi:hypothetical protein
MKKIVLMFLLPFLIYFDAQGWPLNVFATSDSKMQIITGALVYCAFNIVLLGGCIGKFFETKPKIQRENLQESIFALDSDKFREKLQKILEKKMNEEKTEDEKAKISAKAKLFKTLIAYGNDKERCIETKE